MAEQPDQAEQPAKQEQQRQQPPDKSDKSEKPDPVDELVVTRHVVHAADGTELRYTATCGRMVLRREEHREDAFDGHLAKAEVFLTAYTLDGTEPRNRPVTFAFNGGPGSSSVWLHLGLLGPRRVLSGDVGALTPPPYDLVDNPHTLLKSSDLVFVDPVSTGYSRPTKGEKSKDFHGFSADLESVGEVIRLWTTRHGRWLSPKYLCGESYGTLRAAGLARHLQEQYGMNLNGLMLISTVLDLGLLRGNGHNDHPYAMFLPTYAALAHYHGLHGDRPLPDLLDEAEAYAARDYPWALSRGARLTAAERTEAASKLATLTSLSEDYLDRVNLRIDPGRFFAELLRSRRLTVGRLDGRFTGWADDYGREALDAWADPAMDAIRGPYTAAFNHYVRAELGFASDLPYEIISRATNSAWSFKEFEGQNVTVADRLAVAIRANPYLRVYVGCGYHDGATPYFAAQHTVAHLAIPEELRGNVEFAYYPAGHMMYVHEPSRIEQSAHLARFVEPVG
ncbi:MAG: S10 family peptidase [Natronosporangium sp.]